MTALVQDHFAAAGVYLDTPTYGLAADPVVDALHGGIARWRAGTAAMTEYDDAVARARVAFAALVNVPVDRVAVANQVSPLVGVVAGSLDDRSVVVLPEGEFTSLLFPFLVHQHRLTIRQVPGDELGSALTPGVDLVAFSLVHSATGRVIDGDAIADAARSVGAAVLVDATQAAGWLPFDASRFDYVVASAYKWLLCPRGAAFLVVAPERVDRLVPFAAGWYSGEQPWLSIYGGPLRLATSARRFDVSPAWLCWLGAAPALELLASIGIPAIHRHDVALADDARRRLGLAPTGSAIVSIPIDDDAPLRDRDIAATVRSGSVRVGFHVYNSAADVDALVAAVRALV
jgi:selenocysteine lyase/cysteine desulfurase